MDRGKFKLKIAEPCNENWELMSPQMQGRHCNRCNKVVIDFSTWSDAELSKYFSTNKTAVCGRFINTQLNRPINIPRQPHSRLYRLVVAMGFTLLFTNAIHAQHKQPAPVVLFSANTTSPLIRSIKGVVRTSGEPVPFAQILLLENGRTVTGAISNFDGSFTMPYPAEGPYDVVVTKEGLSSFVSKVVIMKDKLTHMTVTTLTPKHHFYYTTGLVGYHKVDTIGGDDEHGHWERVLENR